MSSVTKKARIGAIRTTLKCGLVAALLLAISSLFAQDVRPDLALWRNIKRALLDTDGREYFEYGLKDCRVPGGTNGVTMFMATVVSASPSSKPSTLVVAIVDNATPEATLKLDRSLRDPVKPGAKVEFQGVPVAFSKEPFMITFDVAVDELKFERSIRH